MMRKNLGNKQNLPQTVKEMSQTTLQRFNSINRVLKKEKAS